jgi:hypothetical protein
MIIVRVTLDITGRIMIRSLPESTRRRALLFSMYSQAKQLLPASVKHFPS